VNVEYGDFSEVFGGGGGGGFSDFFEALFGGGRTSDRDTQRRRGGRPRAAKGQDTEAEMVISLEDAHRGGVHRITIQAVRACPACNGTGEFNGTVCATCRGQGQVLSPKTIDVNIPPGAREGSVIKLARQGQPGPRGGEPGDLYVKLGVRPHPVFSVSGDDITAEAAIAPWEAVLGAKIEVPTIEGKAEMTVPAGAQGGQRMRLRGQGLNRRGGGRGDLYVKLKIVVPTHPTDREKELFKNLAQASNFNPRAGSEK
jgi:DnaJ-class molecular chaperone